MAPTHIIITLAGVGFNLINGSMIGGWLGGFGSTAKVPTWQIVAGSSIFLVGLWGNIYHEEILRDIRNKPGKVSKDEIVVDDNGRIYKVPQGGLFDYIWYPHVGNSLRCFWALALNCYSTFPNGASGRGT
jgi:3-oxo-5-alpha-steroid 4-dehydrogenase 1